MEYRDDFDAAEQLDNEEWVAAQIFDYEYEDPDQRPSEEACAALGKRILKGILAEFRQDMFQVGRWG